ncbi:MarC family protein [Kiritimatiellota bacterium B12222]|nr:MarC family protein [Kiritimatiellota bacterium B12222]
MSLSTLLASSGADFISDWITFFFLLTPFFCISAFLTFSVQKSKAERKHLAIKSTIAMLLIATGLFLFGDLIFRVFGITVDSFRVGAGILLFLVALDSVRGRQLATTDAEDLSVVPLAVPIAVGPGTIGAILVMGSESTSLDQMCFRLAALCCAILSLGGLYLGAHVLEKYIPKDLLAVLSKLTGLFLAAFAAELIFTGARHLLMAPVI